MKKLITSILTVTTLLLFLISDMPAAKGAGKQYQKKIAWLEITKADTEPEKEQVKNKGEEKQLKNRFRNKNQKKLEKDKKENKEKIKKKKQERKN